MSQRNVPRPAAVYGIDIGKNIFHVVGLGSDGVARSLVLSMGQSLLQNGLFQRGKVMGRKLSNYLVP
ncbi:hypothetical protein GOB36_31015 [Sinorhizobium meliloti]|uniref:hypothetical protein n=1 Tax=Rhizobium meliloti TaxID=382 RepID=UPI00299E58A1|nr:hypothetical protein [Sinorhizobium meliloti]MDX0036050.1 hypothetical protein [Sinorhizobium meliloti]